MSSIINNWKIILPLCLTLGLAPFIPEPHLWGKLKWVFGGAIGMNFQDWFDIVLHGFPFVLLLRLLILKSKKNIK
ncbi:hypothetical protein GH721_07755 [Kriegella sp. EG-1]|nr:hypothetical protein [Flavobacteriaceae bacterium EG-1]